MNDNWTKEDYLDNPFVMAHLQHLTEYQKESLLGMIEAKTILPHLQKIANAVFKVWDRYQDNPMLQREMAMETATWNGDNPDRDPSEWTQAEVKIVNEWWDKTFPGEDNPLYLPEEE